MPKLSKIRERWFFTATFGKDGALEKIVAVGKGGDVHYHDGVSVEWKAFPADFYVHVENGSVNAGHLVADYEDAGRSVPVSGKTASTYKLDGPGFIVGVCVRDLA